MPTHAAPAGAEAREAPTPAIEARGLTRSFGSVTALTGVDLTVGVGEVHALLGPNGAGKTTLVRILATLSRPDSGSVTVAGVDALRAPRRARELISVTGQQVAVDDLLTCAQNLRLAGRLHGLTRQAARRRADELLAAFALDGVAGRLAKACSGGTRRRLDLAMGLVRTPAVLFLDEPTTGLDPRSRQGVWDIVTGLAGSGVTVLLTTQYLDEADRLAERVSLLDGGRITASGTAAALKTRLGTAVAELTFSNSTAHTRAVAALRGRLPAQRAATLEVDPAARRVRVPTDGSAGALRGLLAGLDDDGLRDAELTLRAPTLDDVFLALTSTSAAG